MPKYIPESNEQRPADLAGPQQEPAEKAPKANGNPAVTIRPCRQIDFEAIHSIVNDAAEAYRGVISADCWTVPYMPREELRHEIAAGVVFWGCEVEAELAGVMGIHKETKEFTYG
jgi:hypothetical protein